MRPCPLAGFDLQPAISANTANFIEAESRAAPLPSHLARRIRISRAAPSIRPREAGFVPADQLAKILFRRPARLPRPVVSCSNVAAMIG
jgi:hypothetical protein